MNRETTMEGHRKARRTFAREFSEFIDGMSGKHVIHLVYAPPPHPPLLPDIVHGIVHIAHSYQKNFDSELTDFNAIADSNSESESE